MTYGKKVKVIAVLPACSKLRDVRTPDKPQGSGLFQEDELEALVREPGLGYHLHRKHLAGW